jgi:hypothetical protein
MGRTWDTRCRTFAIAQRIGAATAFVVRTIAAHVCAGRRYPYHTRIVAKIERRFSYVLRQRRPSGLSFRPGLRLAFVVRVRFGRLPLPMLLDGVVVVDASSIAEEALQRCFALCCVL